MELSISSQALSTERGSVPCSDAFLIDANRAEALATTESANSEENSTLGEETTQATLPVQKVSSPGRLDRELMPCSRVIGEGVAAAPDAAVHMSRSRASCAFAADAAVSRSALSASAISRCIWWKRPLRRSVVAFATSSARLVRAASVDTFKEPSPVSWPRDEPSRWRAVELGEASRWRSTEPGDGWR